MTRQEDYCFTSLILITKIIYFLRIFSSKKVFLFSIAILFDFFVVKC